MMVIDVAICKSFGFDRPTDTATKSEVCGVRESSECVFEKGLKKIVKITVGIADRFKPPFQESMFTVNAKKSNLGMRFK